jgi:hypothetical protein
MLFTVIEMDDGVLGLKLCGEGTADAARWRRALAPAIAWLRSVGGGRMVVTHHPADLA